MRYSLYRRGNKNPVPPIGESFVREWPRDSASAAAKRCLTRMGDVTRAPQRSSPANLPSNVDHLFHSPRRGGAPSRRMIGPLRRGTAAELNGELPRSRLGRRSGPARGSGLGTASGAPGSAGDPRLHREDRRGGHVGLCPQAEGALGEPGKVEGGERGRCDRWAARRPDRLPGTPLCRPIWPRTISTFGSSLRRTQSYRTMSSNLNVGGGAPCPESSSMPGLVVADGRGGCSALLVVLVLVEGATRIVAGAAACEGFQRLFVCARHRVCGPPCGMLLSTRAASR